MLSSRSVSVVFVAAFMVSVIGLDNLFASQAKEKIKESLTVECSIGDENLGIEVNFNGYGSAMISISNSGEPLQIGSDAYMWVEAPQNSFNRVLMMYNFNTVSANDLSNFVYACNANNFCKINDDAALFAFGPGGDWLNLSGVIEKYKGSWPRTVNTGKSVIIKHRLATWPGGNTGWLATPIFTGADEVPYRLLTTFGTKDASTKVIFNTTEDFLQIIKNKDLPVDVRVWGASWLARVKDPEALQELGNLLAESSLDIELRKGIAKCLSTQAPPEAMEFVDKVLWDTNTPQDLQMICFYSYTWTKHPEAKEYIAKATSHPYYKVKQEAEKYKK